MKIEICDALNFPSSFYIVCYFISAIVKSSGVVIFLLTNSLSLINPGRLIS